MEVDADRQVLVIDGYPVPFSVAEVILGDILAGRAGLVCPSQKPGKAHVVVRADDDRRVRKVEVPEGQAATVVRQVFETWGRR